MEPMELTYWIRKWELDENLIYKKAAVNQASWVRNKIAGNLLKCKCFIVSTHHSKSCLLPVYYLKMRNGIKVIMRENFYDWKVSVEIPSEYPALPSDILPLDCLSYSMVENPLDKISSCYLEGFKEEWGYDAYVPSCPGKKFTIEVPDDERLYVILHSLKHAYPEVSFDVSSDSRSVSEIKDSIDRILDKNGYNDMEETEDFGKKHLRHVMSLWEILWRTYCVIDDYRKDDQVTVREKCDCMDNPEVFADVVSRFDFIHREFLMEEWMYKVELD